MSDSPKAAAEHAKSPDVSLDLTDPELKKRVMACIEKNSKLSIFSFKEGAKRGENGFQRVD